MNHDLIISPVTAEQERERAVEIVLSEFLVNNGAKEKNVRCERLRTDKSTLSWVYHFPTRALGDILFKARFGGANPERFMSKRVTAIRMEQRHQWLPRRHFGLYVLSPNPTSCVVSVRHYEKNNSMYFSECHHIPKKSIFVEVKEFVKGIPYGQMLREMNRTPRARFRLIDHEYAQAVAETLHRIHTVKPQGSDFDLDEGSFEDTIKRVYRKSIRDILDRLLVNTPADITHPYITKQIRGQLLDYGSELVQKWSGRWHEACAQHGDARTDNYIITTEYKKRPMAVPIDFSRVEWCHPGFDNGRFVADLIEHVFDSDSHQHQKIVGTFLDTSMRLSKDPHYLESLCLGVFSMLLIKLNPERDPIRDPRLAKRFLEFCMGTLKTGYLSW